LAGLDAFLRFVAAGFRMGVECFTVFLIDFFLVEDGGMK
jgi:hypothetical protein